jgi:hypothetical protein
MVMFIYLYVILRPEVDYIIHTIGVYKDTTHPPNVLSSERRDESRDYILADSRTSSISAERPDLLKAPAFIHYQPTLSLIFSDVIRHSRAV